MSLSHPVGHAENDIRKEIQYPEIQILAEPDLFESPENVKIANILKPIFQRFDDVCGSHTVGCIYFDVFLCGKLMKFGFFFGYIFTDWIVQ